MDNWHSPEDALPSAEPLISGRSIDRGDFRFVESQIDCQLAAMMGHVSEDVGDLLHAGSFTDCLAPHNEFPGLCKVTFAGATQRGLRSGLAFLRQLQQVCRRVLRLRAELLRLRLV